MRIFGSERMDGMLRKLGLEDGEAIVHPWINKALEKAQEKVEARNFEIRKQLLKYDDVMNDQRKVIYDQRKDIMRAEEVGATITDMRHQVIEDLIARTIPAGTYKEQWDLDTLNQETHNMLGLSVPIAEWAAEEGIADQEIQERLIKASNQRMAEKVANYGRELMRMAEKSLLLQIVDQHWKEHLLALDHLRQGINLRAYAQRDPLNEYKREAFNLFETMLGNLRQTVTGVLAHLEVQSQATPEEMEARMAADRLNQEMHEGRIDPSMALGEDGEAAFAGGEDEGGSRRAPVVNRAAEVIDPEDPSTWGKVARNSVCPCGSGKKFKHCHGRIS
jgi:preprotein translocase subunit SecA